LYSESPEWQESEEETLRSANQHLLGMNQALRHKIKRLELASDDLNNLLRGSNLATIFLDRNLRIDRFTPQAQQLFNLQPADRGRPFAHITDRLEYNALAQDAEEVCEGLQQIEREIQIGAGEWYLVRLRPYRTADDRIEGVVLTLIDISARVMAETETRRARDELELRVRERTEELSTANAQLQAEIAERARLESERTELLRRLVTLQEDERRRLARELHDQLGQSVTALSLGLGILANPTIDSAERQQTLERLQQITAQIDQEMSRMALNLRPTALDDLGLIPALQHHLVRWTEQSGIRSDFQSIELENTRLPSELESVIYRVIQEALTNVLKHSGARHVSVLLEQRRDRVRVIVEDDGRGFDIDALQQRSNGQRRLGLVGMRERIALADGMLDIETALGAGTTVFVQLPIPQGSLHKLADA
jgi:PAS domain S-box-containing protein